MIPNRSHLNRELHKTEKISSSGFLCFRRFDLLLKKMSRTKCDRTSGGKYAFMCTSNEQPHSMSASFGFCRRQRLAQSHVSVVSTMPIKMKSTITMYAIQWMLCRNVKSNIQVNPIDVTANLQFKIRKLASVYISENLGDSGLPNTHRINNTKKAGSSRAN